MNLKLISWNIREMNNGRKRMVIKNLMRSWKADVVCFQETKVEGDISNMVKEVWGNKWAHFAQLEASGTRGGVVIMWDKRVWDGEISSIGEYSISCCFTGVSQDLKWLLTGVYAPIKREERIEAWWEIGAARCLFTGPWVLCGDFNTVRFPSEKKNCCRINKSMSDFSNFVEDMELVDPDLYGGNTRGKKGIITQ